MMQIGLAEIGSSGIRILGVSFHDDNGLRAIFNDTMRYSVSIADPSEHEALQVRAVIQEAQKRLSAINSDVELIYGTELCRIVSRKFPGLLPAYVRVITPQEEAMSAWAAGLVSVESRLAISNETEPALTVLDLGSGSAELASGTWSSRTVKEFAFTPMGLGSQALAAQCDPLSSSPYIETIHNEVKVKLGLGSPHGWRPGRKLIALGSAATKVAWLLLRRTEEEEYRPHVIANKQFRINDTVALFQRVRRMFEGDSERARVFVDRRVSDDSEVRRFLTGSATIMFVMQKLGYEHLYVGGYGTRYGLAFLLRHGLVDY